MHVTLAHPPGYGLAGEVLCRAEELCKEQSGSLTISEGARDGLDNCDAVYVKSWGSTALYGKPEEQTQDFAARRDWMLSADRLGGRTPFVLHCLPVRRNVVIADEVLDSPASVVVDQAENRMWVQTAVLADLLKRTS